MTDPSAEAVPFVEKLSLQQTGTLIASRDDNRFQVSVVRSTFSE